MDIRIFDYYENSDYNKLLDFNNKTHIFKEIVPAEYGILRCKCLHHN